MNHSFDVEVAKVYGVPQAIIIANFQHWIVYNAANGTNYHEGRYWTYNSHKALSEIFPYYSPSQIKRTIQRLVDVGVLIRKSFNQKNFDKTNWYTFANVELFLPKMVTKKSVPMGRNRPSQKSDQIVFPSDEIVHSLDGIVKPIPVNTTDNKPSDSKREKKEKGCSEKIAANFQSSDLGFEGQGSSDGAKEKPPVAQPPQSEKPKTLYTQMMDSYFVWHNQQTGVDPIIDGGQGKAMKAMVAYFESQARKRLDGSGADYSQQQVSENAVAAFQTLLVKLSDGSVDPFYATQIKVTQIFSNLSNIINQLKNGTTKQQQQRLAGKPAAGSSESIEDIKQRLNDKYAGM